MRYRTRPSTPGNRARELQEKREKIARKSPIASSVPAGLDARETWAWEAGDQHTKMLLAHGAVLRQAGKEAERLSRSCNPETAREQYPLYIRGGALPGGGRSFTARRLAAELGAGTTAEYDEEAGVSCFRARSLDDDPDDHRTGYEVWLQNRKQAAALCVVTAAQRTAFLITGEEIGTGGDAEPLLRDPEIVARVDHADLEVNGPGEPYFRSRRSAEYIASSALETFEQEPEAAAIASALAGELPILEELFEHATGKASAVHGPEHWQRVCAAGLTLCERDERADPLLVFLFALFHDAMREHDSVDPDHAQRGAELARRLLEGRISADRLEVLETACALHDAGCTSTHPTIAACWDADRLNLWRVGVEPDPDLLSTEAAPALIQRGREMQEETYTWAGLVAWFAHRFASGELWNLKKTEEEVCDG